MGAETGTDTETDPASCFALRRDRSGRGTIPEILDPRSQILVGRGIGHSDEDPGAWTLARDAPPGAEMAEATTDVERLRHLQDCDAGPVPRIEDDNPRAPATSAFRVAGP